MPSFTFVSTANAFVLRGARPVFVDIRPDTLNLDESLVEAAITPRTRAIVPVHYAGVGCSMDAIMDVARRHRLTVIEDAAQGLLARYRDRPLGSIGHLAAISFHETKNVISGEGGALLINDERFLERAEIVWEKGTDRGRFFRGQVDKYTWAGHRLVVPAERDHGGVSLGAARGQPRDHHGASSGVDDVPRGVRGAGAAAARQASDGPRALHSQRSPLLPARGRPADAHLGARPPQRRWCQRDLPLRAACTSLPPAAAWHASAAT